MLPSNRSSHVIECHVAGEGFGLEVLNVILARLQQMGSCTDLCGAV
ncbi:MAG: hypothetical protein OXN89_18400 [Bryobacterales bacterium]|nr:hypothetical protein [Bryobacterales bacterium]